MLNEASFKAHFYFVRHQYNNSSSTAFHQFRTCLQYLY